MAMYPCSSGLHRYAGAQQAVYVTTLDGSGVSTYRLRLCPRHFLDAMAGIERELEPVDEAMRSSLVCERCDEPKQETVFARVFAAHAEEAQYCADLCATHGREARDRITGGAGERLAGR